MLQKIKFVAFVLVALSMETAILFEIRHAVTKPHSVTSQGTAALLLEFY
jgi:hypothetical protein